MNTKASYPTPLASLLTLVVETNDMMYIGPNPTWRDERAFICALHFISPGAMTQQSRDPTRGRARAQGRGERSPEVGIGHVVCLLGIWFISFMIEGSVMLWSRGGFVLVLCSSTSVRDGRKAVLACYIRLHTWQLH